ncbi:uncharacterized protein IL334_002452 [Kwoniella shivajii]|uniref:AB hydrolase-1 domain-containing protein n=1 Tax=Kwoniella shivajii TaxID=564305 RepID=A0ABZ1CUW1_9TREE|nr:hypothetical protein IL334_002452 [Kwoniella shivajii]
MINLARSPMTILIWIGITFLNILPYLCALHLSTSLSQIYLGTNFCPTSSYLLSYAVVESVFLLYSSISTTPQGVRREISNESRRKLFSEAMHALEGQGKEGVDEWLKGWFRKPSVEMSIWQRMFAVPSMKERLVYPTLQVESEKVMQLKRGNVEELLCGIFFNSSLETVLSTPLLHHNLTSMIHSIEIKRNFRFKSGYDKSLEPIRPNSDAKPISFPSTIGHRPLMVYLSVALLDGLFNWIMWIIGFSKSKQGWYHPGLGNPGSGVISHFYKALIGPASSSPLRSYTKNEEQREENRGLGPIILIPGLAGPSFLLHLIIPLLTLERPMLIVDQPHLSLRLFRKSAPTLEDLSESIKISLKSRGHDLERGGSIIIAHSLGSALASTLTNQSFSTIRENRIDVILLDPISVLLTHSHLCRTIYVPSQDKGAMEMLVGYFTRERGMARYLSNEFHPFEAFLSLRSNDVKCGSSQEGSSQEGRGQLKVVLSRRDHLLPIEEIRNHCERNQVDCEILEEVGHGGWLLHPSSYSKVFNGIKMIVLSSNNCTDEGMEIRSTKETESDEPELKSDMSIHTSNSINMGMVRNRSRSLIQSSFATIHLTRASSKSTSTIREENTKMGRIRSKTMFSRKQPILFAHVDTMSDQQQHFSMSRQCSAIGMNRTMSITRFKGIAHFGETSVGVWQ